MTDRCTSSLVNGFNSDLIADSQWIGGAHMGMVVKRKTGPGGAPTRKRYSAGVARQGGALACGKKNPPPRDAPHTSCQACCARVTVPQINTTPPGGRHGEKHPFDHARTDRQVGNSSASLLHKSAP